MKVIVCCKITLNEEEINVLPDRKLDYSDASLKISQYDLNALESGKLLAAQTGGKMTALSAGSSAFLENSKIRKDILSRGADDLTVVMDDTHDYCDSLQTAKAIAAALNTMEYDVVLCGAGSGDLYDQVSGVQIGTLLGLPVVNNVSKITVSSDSMLTVERTLEDETETLEVPLPAVLSVSSEINVPPVPNMREIMRAGKKPVTVLPATAQFDASCEVLDELAPMQQERRQQIVEGDDEAAVDELVQFIRKEGF